MDAIKLLKSLLEAKLYYQAVWVARVIVEEAESQEYPTWVEALANLQNLDQMDEIFAFMQAEEEENE